jgi:hypothetical protein
MQGAQDEHHLREAGSTSWYIYLSIYIYIYIYIYIVGNRKMGDGGIELWKG